MLTRERVRLAERMYTAQETCQRLYGDEWPAMSKSLGEGIIGFGKANNLETLPAAIRMADSLKDKHDGDMLVLIIMGAVVDLIEKQE